MKLKTVLPFLFAPVVGVLIGVQFFKTSQGEDALNNEDRKQAEARQAQQGSSAPGNREAAKSFVFNDLMSVMGGGQTVASSPERRAAFRAALKMAPGEARTQAMQAAFSRWVLENPSEALAYIDDIPAEERQTIVATALAALARQQPDKFRNYSATIGKDADSVLSVTLDALAEKNPAQALEWIRQYPELDANGELTATVLPALLRSDVALAARTVASMNERAPVSLVQQVAASYAQQDPTQAYQWVRQIMQNRSDLPPSQLLNEVSSSLATSDPAAAASYLNRASDPEVRKSLMSEIAIRKGQDDLAGAVNWLNQYNADPGYREAAQNLLYRWSYTKPQEVAKILPSIGDRQVQAAAATHLSHFWQQQDKASYERWLATLPQGDIRSAAASVH